MGNTMKFLIHFFFAGAILTAAACGPIETFNPANPFTEEFALTQSLLCAGDSCPGNASGGTVFTANAVKFTMTADTMVYVGRALSVTIEARRADDSIETDFVGSVTLTTTGSATGGGSVALTGGSATVQITDQLEENFTLGLTDSAGTGLTLPAAQNVFSNRLYLYFTAGTTDGNLTGPSGADSFCMGDGNYPGSGTFHAMLADGTTRVANGGQLNWVFKPNVNYYRQNGDVHIFTTDANSLFVFGSMNVPFGPSATRIWTGMNGAWVTHASTCGGFTGTGGNGGVGDANAVGDQAINFGAFPCTNLYGLVCVEQ